MAPQTTKRWTVEGHDGFESLTFHESASLPSLGDHDVLVRFHAASLNFRDLAISRGKYPFAVKDHVVPGSDGAGTVEAVGPRVTRFQPGAKVVTLFNQKHMAGSLNPVSSASGTGGAVDGTLTQYGVFNEEGLLKMPSNLNWFEAGSLSCAAVTAWNALYGLVPLKPGETVLTQGTGGVSIFAVQFAVAAGARVIATTSSDAKAEQLKKLGAHHVLNYRTDPNWGETAKSLTPDGEGVSHVLEVAGDTSMAQSLKAIKIDGVISIIGYIGGSVRDERPPGFTQLLSGICTARGVYVGSRAQFEDMNRAIEANDIHPVIDSKVFKLEELKEAYQHMADQKHVGKICIQID